ncbi:MAG: hypothetical protein M1409_05885 [Actinobacteria bacterium]|nr:hypothetical protein [Actinomycetota bacterium]
MNKVLIPTDFQGAVVNIHMAQDILDIRITAAQFFPTKTEQIEQLKNYKQVLIEEIGEIDKRLKYLE